MFTIPINFRKPTIPYLINSYLSQMKHFTPFRIYQNPLEAEELIEVFQKHNIPFVRTFEKMDDSEDYVGSNPFDANIILKIKDEDFPRVEALIIEESNMSK